MRSSTERGAKNSGPVSKTSFDGKRRHNATTATLNQSTMTDSVERSKRAYAVWVALMPSVTFTIAFGALCAWECTVAPWFTFFIAPAVALFLWLISAANYVKWSYQLPQEPGKTLRRYISFSILWAPILAGFSGLLIFSVITGVVSLAGL